MVSKLTHAEMLVMGIIWDAPKQLVLSEVVAKCKERYNKDWKPQTVSTYLGSMVRKGFLMMHRHGKTYTYEPLKDKDEYMTAMLEALCLWYSEDMRVIDIVNRLFKFSGEQECTNQS